MRRRSSPRQTAPYLLRPWEEVVQKSRSQDKIKMGVRLTHHFSSKRAVKSLSNRGKVEHTCAMQESIGSVNFRHEEKKALHQHLPRLLDCGHRAVECKLDC